MHCLSSGGLYSWGASRQPLHQKHRKLQLSQKYCRPRRRCAVVLLCRDAVSFAVGIAEARQVYKHVTKTPSMVSVSLSAIDGSSHSISVSTFMRVTSVSPTPLDNCSRNHFCFFPDAPTQLDNFARRVRDVQPPLHRLCLWRHMLHSAVNCCFMRVRGWLPAKRVDLAESSTTPRTRAG